jgi:hypothetical protein
MKSFLALLALALGLNAVFAVLTYIFFHGQIQGVETPMDYFYYAVGHLTTAGVNGMTPTTSGVRIWTAMYVLVAWVYIIYIAVNHITNVKFGRLG